MEVLHHMYNLGCIFIGNGGYKKQGCKKVWISFRGMTWQLLKFVLQRSRIWKYARWVGIKLLKSFLVNSHFIISHLVIFVFATFTNKETQLCKWHFSNRLNCVAKTLKTVKNNFIMDVFLEMKKFHLHSSSSEHL